MSRSYLQLHDLSPAERKALIAYKSASELAAGSGCFDLNRELRNGLTCDELPSSFKTIVEGLDSVFSRCHKLSEEITVYRGVGWAWHLPLADLERDFRTQEYWSTCASRDGVLSFLKAAGECARGAILTLQLPIGLPAYNMESLDGFGGDEEELLLPRGIRWTVKSCRHMDRNELPDYVWDGFDDIVDATLQARL